MIIALPLKICFLCVIISVACLRSVLLDLTFNIICSFQQFTYCEVSLSPSLSFQLWCLCTYSRIYIYIFADRANLFVMIITRWCISFEYISKMYKEPFYHCAMAIELVSGCSMLVHVNELNSSIHIIISNVIGSNKMHVKASSPHPDLNSTVCFRHCHHFTFTSSQAKCIYSNRSFSLHKFAEHVRSIAIFLHTLHTTCRNNNKKKIENHLLTAGKKALQHQPLLRISMWQRKKLWICPNHYYNALSIALFV